MKIFLINSSGGLFVQCFQATCAVMVEGNMRNISVNYNIEFGTVVQEEMLFKDISYLELWWPLSSVEWNHLCNFGREHHEEQFCEINLNLSQRIGRCRLKTFLI